MRSGKLAAKPSPAAQALLLRSPPGQVNPFPPKAELCPPAMQAAIDGGFEIVEFTLTTPGCLDQVANFRKKLDGKVMVGCGTVMDIPDAKAAMEWRRQQRGDLALLPLLLTAGRAG